MRRLGRRSDGSERSQSAVRALARRELGFRVSVAVGRRRVRLEQALRREDGAAVLGFSRDGRFLLLVSWWDASGGVEWREARFLGDERQSTARSVYTLRVGHASRSPQPSLAMASHSFSACDVRVWQSVDCALVVAIAADRQAPTSVGGSKLFHLSLAPAPPLDATIVSSLHFSYSVQGSAQTLKPWQLLSIENNAYHLLLNLGSSVAVLVFCIKRDEPHNLKKKSRPEQRYPWSRGDTPHGPGVSFFAQSEWFYTPEFPIEFVQEKTRRSCDAAISPTGQRSQLSISVECLAQQTFDTEKFLQAFLAKFARLRHYYLVDYDLRLVRAISTEKTLFMSCVMQLEYFGDPQLTSSSTIHDLSQRLALFFSLDLVTGQHQTIRALKVPLIQPLRHLSTFVAQSFQGDINGRVPPDECPSSWDSAAVMREQSLRELHNPVYPVSICLE